MNVFGWCSTTILCNRRKNGIRWLFCRTPTRFDCLWRRNRPAFSAAKSSAAESTTWESTSPIKMTPPISTHCVGAKRFWYNRKYFEHWRLMNSTHPVIFLFWRTTNCWRSSNVGTIPVASLISSLCLSKSNRIQWSQPSTLFTMSSVMTKSKRSNNWPSPW